jgi:hypothetical protein
MCEKELLVAYLYDDLGDADRARFETHLRGCADCRDDLKALRGVRADLVTWAPSQPDFAFRVVREPLPADGGKVVPFETPAARSLRGWWTPAAGLAAAAVLVLAAAAALAHVDVHRGPDGITVRTGWSAFAPASGRSFGETSPAFAPTQSARGYGETSPDVQPASPKLGSGVGGPKPPSGEGGNPPGGEGVAHVVIDAATVAGIERRIRALETAAHDSPVRNASTLSARASDAEIIRRVTDMLSQSETKQQRELALRVAQVIHDVDAQRVADLNRIQQGMGRIDASVNAEAAAHRDLTNYILTSAKQR